jgi:hypothetical protein
MSELGGPLSGWDLLTNFNFLNRICRSELIHGQLRDLIAKQSAADDGLNTLASRLEVLEANQVFLISCSINFR